MSNIISVLILTIGSFVSLSPSTGASMSTFKNSEIALSASLPESQTTISATASSTIEATVGDLLPVEKGNFFTRNWGALFMGLLGFADLVTRLTPTEKDNSIVNFLVSVFNAIIPNLKKGGGRL